MRKEQEITKELDAALATYRPNANKWTAAQIAESNAKVKKLQAELSGVLSDGANPCPKCKNVPIGMRRGEAIAGSLRFPIYEVGCAVCPPVIKGQVRTSFAATAASAAQAVENWNDGKFTEDSKIG